MGSQANVDLSALDEVMRKLNGVLKSMQETRGSSAHSTYLPKGALGTGFEEEQELHGAHTEMKRMIEQDILDKLEDLIDDFGKKTKKVKETYEDNEADTKNALYKG